MVINFWQIFYQKWGTLADQVKSVLSEYPKLRLTQGRKVINLLYLYLTFGTQ
jgi:hypothetical protein